MTTDPKTVNIIVESLKSGINPRNKDHHYKHKYTLTNDVSIKNYLGVKVLESKDTSSIEL